MVAFSIFGRPIYRYGIFYAVSFFLGYMFLQRLGKTKKFLSYKRVHQILTDDLDDLMIVVLLGVLIGGRMGHVFLYDRGYYSYNLGEIFQIWNGGMSFVGGFIGVCIGMILLKKRKNIPWNELFLLGDILLCVVPVGIFFGRIGNYLNQELRGKPLLDISEKGVDILRFLHLVYVYNNVDTMERVNTNFLQAGAEGLFLFGINLSILLGQYIKRKVYPGMITGVFLMGYGIVRFFIEFLKDIPDKEMLGFLSISQRIMIIAFFAGVAFYEHSRKQ